jgi:hypothetical protein
MRLRPLCGVVFGEEKWVDILTPSCFACHRYYISSIIALAFSFSVWLSHRSTSSVPFIVQIRTTETP